MTQPSEAINVLLVDDSPSDVALTQEVLRSTSTPIAVEVAHDGIQAIEHLEGLGEAGVMPDLILLDLNMPRMNGHELLERLKAHPTWRRIPVIVLTTSQAEADVLATYDRHANSHIAKPNELPEFIEVIARIESYWLNVVVLPSRSAS